MKSLKLFTQILVVMMTAFGLCANAAEPTIKIVHLTAKETSAALGGESVTVPKVYVVATDGKLILEGKDGATQQIGPVMLALKKTAGIKPSVIYDLLLKKNSSQVSSLKGPVLITLESGSSVGGCNACDNFYPSLLSAVRKQPVSVSWIQVHIERNNYKKK